MQVEFTTINEGLHSIVLLAISDAQCRYTIPQFIKTCPC